MFVEENFTKAGLNTEDAERMRAGETWRDGEYP